MPVCFSIKIETVYYIGSKVSRGFIQPNNVNYSDLRSIHVQAKRLKNKLYRRLFLNNLH